MMQKRVSNGKSTPSNQTDNDNNWKLLKFLCDRIEENKKRNEQGSIKQKVASPAAPIPITGNLLAKRKKKKKKKKKNNKISLSTSPKSSHSLDRLHTKTKTQAL
eukprot:255076_1